ncbi:MAG: hypothetical protein Fues2KO_22840 [Fuerstiella sp.]
MASQQRRECCAAQQIATAGEELPTALLLELFEKIHGDPAVFGRDWIQTQWPQA